MQLGLNTHAFEFPGSNVTEVFVVTHCFAVIGLCHHDLALPGRSLSTNHDIVAIGNLYVDHRLALHSQHEQVVAGSEGLVDPAVVFKELGARGYVTALVEGGSTLATNLVAGGYCDRIIFYLGAKLGLGVGVGAFAGDFATLSAAKPLQIESVVTIGGDLRINTKVVG